MNKLTQYRLQRLLSYNADTGEFRWRIGRGGMAASSIAGGPDKDGYWMISVEGVRYKAHRLAFLYMLGRWPSADVDHQNRNAADNRWVNLRDATRAENMANGGPRKNSKSQVRGVCWTQKGWKAQIKVSGKNFHLGYFPTKELAGDMYQEAAIAAFGKFAAPA